MNIKDLKSKAEKALARIQGDNEYNTKYVLRRLNSSLEKYPHDPVIGSVRDVMRKVASKQEFISKKELAKIHGHLSGLNKQSAFRDELGDLIFSEHNLDFIKKDASAMRVNAERNIETGLEKGSELEKMANEFAGVFNFNNQSFSSLGENSNSKAEKFAGLQLKSMGIPAKEIRAVANNNHFILCKASFTASNFDESSVSIPVKINNGIPEIPTQFVSEGGLQDLTKENLLIHLKASQEESSRARKNAYASQRGDLFDKTWVNVKTASVNNTQLDDTLLESQSKFSSKEINMGRSLLDSELKSFGLRSNNIRYASSNDTEISYIAEVPGLKENVEVSVPFSNGRPLFPSLFSYAGQKRRFSEFEMKKVASLGAEQKRIFEYSNSGLDNMSYNDIVSQMTQSAVNKDYKVAEDCLMFIQGKFGSQEYLNALNKFSSVLKHSSIDSEREELVKAAFNRGDLIRTPTSIELYSPKYAMPLSKLAFDEKGNLVPARTLNSQGSDVSYFNINSSKIVLS
jgi:hypothetical protein